MVVIKNDDSMQLDGIWIDHELVAIVQLRIHDWNM